MNKLKAKLKAIWMILKADGFDVAVTFPTKRGLRLDVISYLGKDTRASGIHWRIAECFNDEVNTIGLMNKEGKEQ